MARSKKKSNKLKITEADIPHINSHALRVWHEYAEKSPIELIRLKGLELYLREKNLELNFEVDLLAEYPRTKYRLHRSPKP